MEGELADRGLTSSLRSTYGAVRRWALPQAPLGSPPPSPRALPTRSQLAKFVNGIQGGFRVTVLLILLIRPSLVPTRHANILMLAPKDWPAGRV